MISAIVLAAGISSRMGEPKALVPIAGQPLLGRVLAAVRASPAPDIVVVLGHQAEVIRRAIPLDGARVVVNTAFAEGMSTSIRAGLAAADPKSDGYLIVLGDQPFVAPATMAALISARSTSSAKIVIPTFRGLRGNPVLVDRSLADEVAAVTGDQGCRAIFGHHVGDILEVAVEDPGILVDIDTPSEAERAGRAIAGVGPLESLLPEGAHGPVRDHRHGRPAGNATRDALSLAGELLSRSEPFALATVVRAVRPTSGKPGFKAIVRPSGEVIGWVGGSCTQAAVRAESLAALRDGHPRLVRLSRDARPGPHEEGIVEYVMECHSGGAMDIYIEPQLPKAQLVIVGDSPIAEALLGLGRLMGYRTILAAPGATSDRFPDADVTVSDFGGLGGLATPQTYAVVATMGMYDEEGLRALAPSQAPYVALVASRRRAQAVRDSLRAEGLPADVLDRIRNPAGMDLAAETPAEIALSIAAEITKLRRTAEPRKEAAESRDAPGLVDLVCGMTVEESTPHRANHGGLTYLFCSDSCRSRFVESPESFLA